MIFAVKSRGCGVGGFKTEESADYAAIEIRNEYTTKRLSLLLDAVGVLQKDMSGASTKKYHGQRCWVLDEAIVEEFMERKDEDEN